MHFASQNRTGRNQQAKEAPRTYLVSVAPVNYKIILVNARTQGHLPFIP